MGYEIGQVRSTGWPLKFYKEKFMMSVAIFILSG